MLQPRRGKCAMRWRDVLFSVLKTVNRRLKRRKD